MRKIMVVDDEKFIRLGLKSMLEKSTDVLYDVTLCRDGLEALETIKKSKFDIVITDIRMPEMTGLEFLENIKAIHEKPEVIFLSGYDEFNYAVQALRNGARDYLLKPINKQVLYKTLKNIEEDLIQKEAESKKDELSSSYEIEISMNELKYIFLKDNIKEEELVESISKINIDLLTKEFFVGAIKSCSKGNMESNDGLLIQNYLKDLMKDEVLFLGPNNEYIILSSRNEFFEEVERVLFNESLCQFTIGISNVCNSLKGIRDAYLQAVKASKYKITLNNRIIIYYKDVENKLKNYKSPIEDINILNNIIGTGRDTEMEIVLGRILDLCSIEKNDINYLDDLTQNIYNLICEYLNKEFFKTHNTIYSRSEKFKDIFNFNSISEYSFELKQYLMEIGSYMKNINDKALENGNLNKALRYINDNYNKDITMATVSNEVSLNYSYFSHVFKEYTGDTFVNYLRKMRIDKAKTLLLTYDLKVYEVAKQVGYEDSKQFAKIFRRSVGVSPVEYRDKYTKYH